MNLRDGLVDLRSRMEGAAPMMRDSEAVLGCPAIRHVMDLLE